MKKSYQLIITFSLVVIAICLGYTTCQSYIATHEIINSKEKNIKELKKQYDEGNLTPERLEILELRIQIYDLKKKIQQYENEEQLVNQNQE